MHFVIAPVTVLDYAVKKINSRKMVETLWCSLCCVITDVFHVLCISSLSEHWSRICTTLCVKMYNVANCTVRLLSWLYFYARKQLLLSARLSHCNYVRPSRGWISQKQCKL